jgi:filamentous hemagglutinin
MIRQPYRSVFQNALHSPARLNKTAEGAAAAHPRSCTPPGEGMGALRLALLTTLGLLVPFAQAVAQIIADPSAAQNRQAQVSNPGHGVPQINIQAPSAAGVSHNIYRQFDVDPQGAVLNNSPSSQQTQLAGQIAGNPALRNGSARVILNEVNASTPSQLHGYLEVAGDRAHVVIANPAGISCDGCGFINTQRATLSTGKPQMIDGQLQGYHVRSGKIRVDGKGLDARQSDATDLIARTLQLNAGVWAKELRVTSGANQIDADNRQATALKADDKAPAVAIDVAQLGGMYADKITLVGTESGVGVRNAGQIGASAGDVTLTADGRIDKRAQPSASTRVELHSAGNLDNLDGARISGDQVSVQARADLNNLGGTLQAGSKLSVSAGRDINLLSSSHTRQHRQGSATTVAHPATLAISASGAELNAHAGRHLNGKAAQVISRGANGTIDITAGGDIHLDTLSVSERRTAEDNTETWIKRHDAGSSVQGQGKVQLTAGHDLKVRGSSLSSRSGMLQATAGHDVTLAAGSHEHRLVQFNKERRGWLAKQDRHTHESTRETITQASAVTSEHVQIQAGNDLQVQGSKLRTKADIDLRAGRNLTLDASIGHVSRQQHGHLEQRGFASNEGIGATLSAQRQTWNHEESERATASTLDSSNGNIRIHAGNNYRQVGSLIRAAHGDLRIAAAQVTIGEARLTQQTLAQHSLKQSDLNLSLDNPLTNSLGSALHTVQAVQQVGSFWMTLLGTANLALEAGKAAIQVALNPLQLGGVAVGIRTDESDHAQHGELRTSSIFGSILSAGGDVDIMAKGADKGDIRLRGSQIDAGRDLGLNAQGDIDLLAAWSNNLQHRLEMESGGDIAAHASLRETGKASVDQQTQARTADNNLHWNNSAVNAVRQATLRSAADTRLSGALLRAAGVKAEVGGDFNLESRQDKSSYSAAQTNNQTNGNIARQYAQYHSVLEQSGIRAGDDGFDIRVTGNSQLKGALLASSAPVLTQARNHLSSNSLILTNIRNRAEARADIRRLDSLNDIPNEGKYGTLRSLLEDTLATGSAQNLSATDTRSAIGSADLTLNETAQQQRTGEPARDSISSMDRNTSHTHASVTRQDVEPVRLKAEAKQQIKSKIYLEAVQYSDEAYRKMFLEKARMFVILTDKAGNVLRDPDGTPKHKELSEAERNNLQAGADGRVHIAENGIVNNENAAAKYAVQHSTSQGPQYFIWFPEASNIGSEMLIATYQGFLENPFWGLSNATTATRDAMLRYGKNGLHLDGHSRGSMTVANAMNALAPLPDHSGSLSNTTVNFYGPAANAKTADRLLAKLQNRNAMDKAKKMN